MNFLLIILTLDILRPATYKVRPLPQNRDVFYELIRAGALNKVLRHSPLLEDPEIEELWTIFHNSGIGAHRMLIEGFLGSLTSVSGNENHDPVVFGNLISEMITSLPNDTDQ